MYGITKKRISEIARMFPDKVTNFHSNAVEIQLLVLVNNTGDQVKLDVTNISWQSKTSKNIIVGKSELQDNLYVLVINEELHRLYPDGKRVSYALLEEFLTNRLMLGVQEITKRAPQPAEPNYPVYIAVNSYGSHRANFYLAVKETESTIWLAPLRKRSLSSDLQNALVEPDLKSYNKGEKVISRRKRPNGSLKVNDYVYAHVWDGTPFQEYSD